MDASRWVRVNLVRLSSHYNARIPTALELIKQKSKDRNHLWLTRAKEFNISGPLIRNYEDQVHKGLSSPELESTLQAVTEIWQRKDKYLAKDWEEGERFLLEKVRSSYLGEVFAVAQKLFQGILAAPEPEDQTAVGPVPGLAGDYR
jgi:hypothetical protein